MFLWEWTTSFKTVSNFSYHGRKTWKSSLLELKQSKTEGLESGWINTAMIVESLVRGTGSTAVSYFFVVWFICLIWPHKTSSLQNKHSKTCSQAFRWLEQKRNTNRPCGSWTLGEAHCCHYDVTQVLFWLQRKMTLTAIPVSWKG